MESPAKFIREVRQEVSKVTWPSRNETTKSTIVVIILTLISALFFYLTDSVISAIVRMILGLAV
jgi:preprotein translocase subunit SecE